MKTVTAVVAKYGVVDSQGDVLAPGCFDDALKSKEQFKLEPHGVLYQTGVGMQFKLQKSDFSIKLPNDQA